MSSTLVGLTLAALALGVPAQAPAESQVERSVITDASFDFYPAVLVEGYASTLIISTLSDEGNYEVCSLQGPGEGACVEVRGLPRGVVQRPVADFGLAANGMLVVQSTDAQTVGVTSLLVEHASGAFDLIDPYTLPRGALGMSVPGADR
ncbi:hypothetical protein HUS23_05955 [Ectothiorhodospiraceae bacterium 2226]|nr:hypothetical protein HUS23_05955 [Ectothiorhodospiraceae bacterium 2226]